MRVLMLALWALAALATMALPAAADKRVALVIGDGAYQTVAALPNPVRDAEAMAGMFRAAGFDHVKVETNVGIAAMRRALQAFADTAADADVAIVFFAGHGVEVGGRNYLVPVDAALTTDIDVQDEAVDLDRVLQALDPVKRLRLVILDAMGQNPFAARMRRATTARAPPDAARLPPKLEGGDTLVAYAARAGLLASEGTGRNSQFTTALLHHLTTPGLDVRIAFGRVHDEVLRATGGKQEPIFYGRLRGDTLALSSLAKPHPPAPVSGPLSETRVALVIGNARYAAQSPLKNPRNDAVAVAAALRGAGFAKVVSASDLTRDALVKSLQEFQDEADRADWAVIYFSGHAVEIGGVNYVVPTDARLRSDRDAPDEAVSLDRLEASVGGARKLRIVILDACRDNPFVASMQRIIASRSAGKGLVPVEPSLATLVVYAAKGGQLAQDGAGDNSPFAAALVKHLGEPRVEVSKLFRLVTDDVLDATGHRQQPFVYGSLPGREDFYFRP